MFKAEDFNLPLETQLKQRVFVDEIDNCTNIDTLKENLKATSKLLLQYQHILQRVLREQIEKNLSDFEATVQELITKEITDNN